MFGGGRLGVSLEDVGADDVGRLGLSAERGAVVTDVQEGSAAEKAGVKDGDVIVRFGGQDVWSAAQLARLVRETPAGRTVDLEVSRGGAIQKLSVALTKPDRDRMFGVGPGGMGEDFHFEMPDLSDLPELADLPAPRCLPCLPCPPPSTSARARAASSDFPIRSWATSSHDSSRSRAGCWSSTSRRTARPRKRGSRPATSSSGWKGKP